jgi:peroxiredoxin Q/BCP
MALRVGDSVPDFQVESSDGPFQLSAQRGEALVLYFYPKDSTPGCTTQACGFRDLRAEFQAAGARIVGVSQDSLKSHDRFIEKQGLTFPLLSDPEHRVHGIFSTWVEKKNYGRVYMGTERSTFLIDAQGKLVQEWRKVRVKGHVDKVLEAVRALG